MVVQKAVPTAVMRAEPLAATRVGLLVVSLAASSVAPTVETKVGNSAVRLVVPKVALRVAWKVDPKEQQ